MQKWLGTIAVTHCVKGIMDLVYITGNKMLKMQLDVGNEPYLSQHSALIIC